MSNTEMEIENRIRSLGLIVRRSMGSVEKRMVSALFVRRFSFVDTFVDSIILTEYGYIIP